MQRGRPKRRKPLAVDGPSSPYTTKIIKAGALLSDTKAFLSCWDPEQSVDENLRQIRSRNLLAKTSRSRAEDILAIFRQRYLSEESVVKALARLVRNGCDGHSLDKILYFHAARADSLLRDVVLQILGPQWARGVTEVSVDDLHQRLHQWVNAGKTTTMWGEYTIRRVAQGLLSTLRDFGLLEGSVKKRIVPVYLPLPAFCYIAFYLRQKQSSGVRLLDMTDWKLFFLPREGVEWFFLDAHQHGLLEYHAAGSVTRLTFPATELEAYADVLTRAAH